ncbi:MAG: TIGR01777 family protein [Calditrichaeota bacterium]|nr:MAG: TIGR01777 family protein [Calditrichota bacterium]
MKIVIAGGSGFLGGRLVDSFLQNAHAVTVISRKPQNIKVQLAGSEIVSWNDLEKNTSGNILSDTDVVINLAGESIGDKRWTKEQKSNLLSSRIDPTDKLVEWVNNSTARPAKFINASAVGYYGNSGGEVLNESSLAGDDFLAEICVAWEKHAARLDQSHTKLILLRIGVVLDPQEGALQKMVLPFKFFAGGKLGSGDQWISWIHIDDLVAIFNFLINMHEIAGIVNATAPNPVTNSRLTKAIANTLNRPALFPVPAFALKLLLGEQSLLVLNGQRVMPENLLQAGFSFNFPEIDAALDDLYHK